MKRTIGRMTLWAGLAFGMGVMAVQAGDWRESVPQPVFEGEAGLVELYDRAWELAWKHVKTQEGMPASPYMDEAFSDTDNWIWDTCFMVQFCKYAPDQFPGIQSLENFYQPLHEGVATPVVIHIADNPPLFAWTEYEYYRLTGDLVRVKRVVEEKQYLQKHFEWFDGLKEKKKFKGVRNETCLIKVDDGYLWEGGRSGMDNTPRGRVGAKADRERPNHPKLMWVDAIAQQGLSALNLARMAKACGNQALEKEWMGKYEAIKKKVNEVYWDEKDGIYYDVMADTKEKNKVKTPAAYWPMLAEMCSAKQAAALVKHLEDEKGFGGVVPWTTVSRDDADFVPDTGNYWRGAVWLPTAYMGTKALEKYGYGKQADVAAEKVLRHMLATYQQYTPHTIWECYSPTLAEPAKHMGNRVRPDFCGWSALGPISMLLENVLGFSQIDADKHEVHWRLHQSKRHGVKHMRFGQTCFDAIYDGKGQVEVETNRDFTLWVNGKKHEVKAGKSRFAVKPPVAELAK